MLKNLFVQKISTTFLSLIMILTLNYGCFSSALPNRIEPITDIMYLVPEDTTKIESYLRLDQFITDSKESDIYYTIGITSDWNHINQFVIAGDIRTIIIHYAALEQINPQQLAYLYNKKQPLVVGIGVPGDRLASLLGNPDIYDSKMGKYGASQYYFAYKTGPGGIKATDTLRNDDDVKRMMGFILGNMALIDRTAIERATENDRIIATLTPQEIDEVMNLAEKHPDLTSEEFERLMELLDKTK